MIEKEFLEFKSDFKSGIFWVLGLLVTLVGAMTVQIATAVWWASSINTQITLQKEEQETRYVELKGTDSKMAEAIAAVATAETRVATLLAIKFPESKGIIHQAN